MEYNYWEILDENIPTKKLAELISEDLEKREKNKIEEENKENHSN